MYAPIHFERGWKFCITGKRSIPVGNCADEVIQHQSPEGATSCFRSFVLDCHTVYHVEITTWTPCEVCYPPKVVPFFQRHRRLLRLLGSVLPLTYLGYTREVAYVLYTTVPLCWRHHSRKYLERSESLSLPKFLEMVNR